jgi:alpha-tubulin suppressor-like RCC1 family protein
VPVSVKLLAGIDQIAAHADFTCAHSMIDQTVWCWGAGDSGQLGNGASGGRNVPQKANVAGAAAAVAAGDVHACALKSDGGVACWGANFVGQLGDGTYSGRASPAPISGLTGVRDLALGHFHSCAVVGSDGGVSCWGDGRDGELGDGVAARITPVAPLLPCP